MRTHYFGVVYLFALLIVAAGLYPTPTRAAPINYGDFDFDVDYLGVTEAANSPGDEEPLYGTPNVVNGSTLAFPSIHNHDFSAVAQGTGDSSDTTIGTLSFTLESNGPLTDLTIMEGGDWGFNGVAGTSGSVAASLSVFVYSDASESNLLTTGDTSTGDQYSGPLATVDTWSLMLTLDLTSFEDDSVYVVINNNLHATKTGAATSFIHKKQFKVTPDVPEPAALTLLAAGLLFVQRTFRGQRRS